MLTSPFAVWLSNAGQGSKGRGICGQARALHVQRPPTQTKGGQVNFFRSWTKGGGALDLSPARPQTQNIRVAKRF
jgi:hypothetical protein